ncbi:hypothetical protein DV515_00018214 [Chloebia gouldiae]|uniref:Transmembrane protein 101 n=1 Tax=Chloebia gouldiae TaxID=44316 RepID=A0A3L8Q848_CHLGU|nr:hypothetical protein DV515_00018214 [Chloebia gouldiae]
MAAARGWRRRALRLLTAGGGVLLTRFPFWHCFSGLLLCAERADLRRGGFGSRGGFRVWRRFWGLGEVTEQQRGPVGPRGALWDTEGLCGAGPGPHLPGSPLEAPGAPAGRGVPEPPCRPRRKPDIPVPYLYVDMGAAVLCASFMSFGVKRRWFALGAALQLALATYASHVGGHAHYGDWLKVRMYSRTVAVIGGFLILASGAGELYRQRPRSRSLQATGQVLLGIYLICQAYSLQHSPEDRLAYLDHLLGGEVALQLLFLLYGLLALAFLSGCYVRAAAQVLAVLLPPAILLVDGNLGYWHALRRVEFWNQMKLIGQNVGIFGAVVILATDG